MTEKELSDFIEHGESGFEEFYIAFGYAWANMAIQIAKELRARLAQPEPKPVVWVDSLERARPECVTDFKYLSVSQVQQGEQHNYIPLYTTPQKKEWVGLTDEEVKEIKRNYKSVGNAVLWTEAKLKEKNHADS